MIMSCRRLRFNLIELVLALGVAAIGMAAIMGVLPYALRSVKTVTSETYLSEAAESIFAKIEKDKFTGGTTWWKKETRSLSDGFQDVFTANIATSSANPFRNASGVVTDDPPDIVAFIVTTPNGKMIDFAASTEISVTKLSDPYTQIYRVKVEFSWPLTKAKYDSATHELLREKKVFMRDFYVK